MANIGSLVADLRLESAAFRRDLGRATAALQSDTARMKKSMREVERSSRNMERQFTSLRRTVASFGTVIAAIGFARVVRDVVDATVAFERIENTLKAGTGSAEGAARAFAFVRGEAQRLGLDLRTAAETFGQLTAAAKGTSFQGQAARDIFTAVAEAMTALGRNSEQARGAFLAIEQIISKGVVSMEELRRQLGDRLPGAFQIAARSMGMTTAEFNKLVASGELMSEQFLPKFAQEIHKTFAEDAVRAAQSLQASLNRLSTTVFAFTSEVGRGGLAEAITDFSESLAEASAGSQSLAAQLGAALGGIVSGLGNAALFAARNIREIVAAVSALVAFKLTAVIGGIASAFLTWVDALRKAAVAGTALNVVLRANPIAAVVGAAAGAIALLSLRTSEAEEAATLHADAIAAVDRALGRAKPKIEAASDETFRLALAAQEANKTQLALLETLILSQQVGLVGTDPATSGQLQQLEELQARVKELDAALTDLAADPLEAFGGLGPTIEGAVKPTTDLGNAAGDSAKKVQDLVEKLERETDQTRRLIEAQRQGEAAIIRVSDEIAAENAVREAGVDIMSVQGQAIREIVLEQREEERSLQDLRDAQEETVRAAKRAAEEQKRLAEQRAEILAEPFKNALRGIQDSFTSAFESIFSGGVNSFSDLADTIKRIMVRLAAEIASLLIFQPVVQGLSVQMGGIGGLGGGGFGFGDLLGGFGQLLGFGGGSTAGTTFAGSGINQAGFDVAAGLGGGGAGGGFFSNIAPAFAGMTLGIGAGTMLNSAAGGNQLGGTIGAGVGAAIGTALFPGIGTVLGGLIGGAAGGLFGGLFGNNNPSVGPATRANVDIVNGRAVITGADAADGGNLAKTRAAVQQFADAVNKLPELLGATGFRSGTAVADFGTVGGQVRVVQGGGVRSFGSAQEAFDAALLGFLKGAGQTAFEGLSAAVESVLANTNAKTLEELASDVDFARNLERIAGGLTQSANELERIEEAAKAAALEQGQALIEFQERAEKLGLARNSLNLAGPAIEKAVDSLLNFVEQDESITEAEKAIASLKGQFEGLAEIMKDLGLDASKAEQALQKSVDALRTGFDESIAQQILNITDPLAAQLEAFDREAQRRVREAEALGADLVAVEKLNMLQRQQIVAQATQSASSDLQRFFEEITFGSLSGATPGGALEGIRASFQATAAQALAGDITARGRVVDLGRSLLERSREFSASGSGFQSDLSLVQSVVSELLPEQDSVVGAINDNGAEQARLLTRLVNEVAALRAENREQNETIEDLTAALQRVVNG